MVTSKRPWVHRRSFFSFVCKYFPLTLDLPSANVTYYVHFEAEGIQTHDPKSSAAPEGGDGHRSIWPVQTAQHNHSDGIVTGAT